MFIEPIKTQNRGWIEVICGSMFSGKTEELIRRLKRAQIANLGVEIFKPLMDKRYEDDIIQSHNNNSLNAIAVNSSRIIPSYLKDTDVVGIDEAQFFDNDLSLVAEELSLKGIRVIIAGLDMDFKGNSFGCIPDLLARADYITKLHAICVVCGNIANYSYRKTEDREKILIGDKDKYEPRCRICFNL